MSNFLKLARKPTEPDLAALERDIVEAAREVDANAFAPAPETPGAAKPTIKTLISSWRAYFEDAVKDMTDRERDCQMRIAMADSARKAAIEAANQTFDEVKADIDEDLFQITKSREALELSVGSLTKAQP